MRRWSFPPAGTAMAVLASLSGGCTEVPATNPYDPEAPIEVQRKASVEGVVTGEGGAPLLGAVVTLTGPTDPDDNPRTTEADGAYRFVGLVPGRYTLSVRHSGHAAREIDLGRVAAGEEIVRPVALTPLRPDATGPEQARLSGVAHKMGELALDDEAARDHSGITVEVQGQGVRTVTNRAGEFDLFLNPGTYVLEISAPNHVKDQSDPIELAAGDHVRLETPFELRSDPGVVRGVVRLEGAPEGGHGDVTVGLANTGLTTTTSDDGRFRIDGVAAGVYTLRAAKEGYDTQLVHGVVVESDPDTVLEELTLPIARGSVRGTVGLAASPSAAGVAVELVDTEFRTLTNEAGGYRLDRVPVGEYTLRACKQGYEPREFAVTIRPSREAVVPPADEAVELARQQIRLAGDAFTTTPTYTLRFDAVPAWATAVKITGDLAAAESTDFRPFDAERGAVDLVLGEGDGSKLINVQLRGDGCHLSDVHQAVVVLDTSGPALGDLRFDEGEVTRQVAVTLRAPVLGAAAIRVTGDLESVAGEAANVGAWIPASNSLALRLDAAADGPKVVTLEARDRAGNPSEPASTSARIVLDRQPPERTAITVEQEPPVTDPDVALGLSAVGATQMQVSNDGAFADAEWVAFAPRLSPWRLASPQADGEKTVYARFRDAAGNVSEPVSVTVPLDRQGEIGGTLRLEGTDACGGAELLVDGAAQPVEWRGCEFVAAPVPVGVRRLRMERPGFESTVLGAVDVPPTGRADLGEVVLARARGSASGVVRLQGRPEGDHGGVLLTFRNVSEPVGVETLPDYVVTSQPDGSFFSEGMWAGRYLVRATREGFTARDLGEIAVRPGADTAVTSADDPAVLTQQVGDFLIDGGAAFTADRRVDLTLQFNDAIRFRVRIDGGPFSDWIEYAPDAGGTMTYRDLDLGEGDGPKRVEVEIEDENRVRSGEPYYQASIVLDTVAPSEPEIIIDGGAEYTNHPLGRVVLTLSAQDANGVDRVRLSPVEDCDGPTVPFRPILGHELDAPGEDGVKDVYACFVDPAGNVSAPAHARITLDTTAPAIQGFAVRDHADRVCSEGCLVDDPRVLLVITEAAEGDTREIKLGRDDPELRGIAWQPRQPGDVPFDLPRANDRYTIYVQARDAAGNVSDVADLSVTLDDEPPAAPVADAPAYIAAPRLPVTLSNVVGVDRVEASWRADFAAPIRLEPAARLVIDLPEDAAPGARTLHLRYVDAAGNESAITRVATIYDIEAPQVAGAVLGYGAPGAGVYLASPLGVPLQVTCFDDLAPQGALELELTDGDGVPQVRALAPLVTVDLPAAEGPSALQVRCVDPAGNRSEATRLEYTVDTVRPPAARNSLEIEDGRSHVNERTVVLTLRTGDDDGGSGVDAVAFANGAIDCDTADYRDPADAYAWVLPPGDGGKTVAACVRDRAGNATRVDDDVVLDTVAPAGDLAFAEGTHSQDATVSARVSRESDDAAKMRLIAGVPDCAAFLPDVLDDAGADFSAEDQPIELPGEGSHAVSVCLFDLAGNAARITREISVDLTDPTGNMDINRGAPYTTSREVTINLSAAADVVEMKVFDLDGPAQDVDCAGDAGYQPLDLAYAHTLPAGDGPKYVRVCLRDASGRWVKLPEGAEPPPAYTITLDTTPPALADPGSNAADGIWIESGAAITNGAAVEVTIAARDTTSGVAEFKLSEGDACTGGAWQEWVADGDVLSTQFSVAPGDNVERAVSVRFRDAAGNTSGCASDSIDVDVVPLSLTAFAVRGQAGDAPGYTSSVDVVVSEIGHDGVGTCARYEVSESNAFPPPPATTRYADCPAGELAYTLRDVAADGVKRLYARAIDAAGNASGTLSATIELDRADPSLDGVTIARGPDARPDGPKYTNRQDVTVTLDNPSGGDGLRYALLEDGAQACPAAGALDGRASLTPSFSVRFAGEGLKKVCVALEDAVGNVSAVRSDTITVDTTPPGSPDLPRSNLPGVNASCAYIEAARADVDDFWKFEARTAGGEWFEIGDGTQDPADPFDPGDPNDTAHIKFRLTQDVDNLLQIRAVDPAGNRGEPSEAIVEEVSSFLIPTDLRVKQLCNGGQYAILKEPVETVTNYRRPTCFPELVIVEGAPEHALLDLERLMVRRLSPTLELSDRERADCQSIALDNSLLDAACSPEAGEAALLIARPQTNAGVPLCRTPPPDQPCHDIVSEYDDLGINGEVQFVVLPDPIGEPLAPLVELSALSDGDHRYPVHSIEALDWTGDLEAGDYRFRALSTDVARIHGRTFNAVFRDWIVTTTWRTYVRRIETVNGVVTARAAYASVSGEGNFAIHGLTIFNAGSHYLTFDTSVEPDRWQVYYTTANGEPGTAVAGVTDVFESADRSPFRNRISPAHFYHVNSGSPAEARGNFVSLRTNGQARARRPLSSSEQILGTGAPEGAAFFEVGEDEVFWVDVDDPRVIYESSTYGSNPTRLRYAVDTTLPVFPALGSDGEPGEPYAIYHTTGVTRGIVLAYSDENDEAAGECAR